MICDARVLDVFVTKDSDGYEFDDAFVCPVWSVAMDGTTATVIAAGPTDAKSEWVSPCTTVPHERLEVGDLVRIGAVATGGYTDYLTVMEVRMAIWLTNGTMQDLAFHDPEDKLSGGTAVSSQYPGQYAEFTAIAAATQNGTTKVRSATAALSGQIVCYRLNRGVECTLPALSWQYFAIDDKEEEMLSQRHTKSHSDSSNVEEKLYYPLYKVKKWLTNNGEISISLDHGVKAMKWMKLVGYSCFNKRQVGFQHAHEMIADDWIAVHIDEVAGNVISNNATANGAFCVLHVGNSHDNKLGAAEFHDHDPNGLFTHHFENQQSIRKLNLKLRDRQGNAAHFGRIHLWFKICVQHG